MTKESNITIDGMRLIELEVFSDGRGSFTESYRSEWFPGAPEMVQGNISRSKVNVLRGMHFHKRQADYWCIVEGRAFLVLYDLRDGSPTRNAAETLTLDAAEPRGMYIPPGVAHGFYAETDLILQYMVDQYFDGEDEHGIAWNDPDLDIRWPATDPILSERDRRNPSLAEILAGPPV